MRTPSLRVLSCFIVAFAGLGAALAGGCGSESTGSGGSGGSGGPGGAGGSGGGTGGSSSSGFDPGSPNTPADGCKEGYVACDEECAHLDEDRRHCGACGQSCMSDEGCVDGACVKGQICLSTEVSCGGACKATYVDADNCGSCENRCADVQLCVDSDCKPAVGDGTSCADALFWDVDEVELAGFRFTPGATVPHTFGCAPGKALPTRWFRFVATKDNTNVQVRAAAGDDYVIELFSGPACDASVAVECNDEEDSKPGADPRIYIDTTEGTTFYVAVGLKGAWSGGPAVIRVDH